MIWLAFTVGGLLVFSAGLLVGYVSGHEDGRRERAREEWRDRL